MPKRKEPATQNDLLRISFVSFRARLLRNLIIGFVVALLAAMVSQILLIEDGESLVYDYRIRKRTLPRLTPPAVSLILFDDEIGADPAERMEDLAQLVSFLDQKGARVIGLDVILSNLRIDDRGGKELQLALASAKNVVLSGRAFGIPSLGQKNFKPPDFLIQAAASSGLQHLNAGSFGVVRDTQIRKVLVGDQTSNNFSAQLVALYEGTQVPTSFAALEKNFWVTPFKQEVEGGDYTIAINYRGPHVEVGRYDGTFPCFRADLKALDRIDSRKYFHDKIVIIGSAVQTENVSYPTPYSATLGGGQLEMWTAEIMGHIAESMLRSDYLWFPTEWGKFLWFIAVALASSLVCLSRKLLPTVLLILLFSVALSLGWTRLLNGPHLVMPFIATMVIPWLTALGCLGARSALDDRELRMLYDIFGRSVSPAIAQELVSKVTSGPDGEGAMAGRLLSEECECSILFLDIANFTALSENRSPEWLFAFINELLDRLSRSVFENHGSLIRYTGDGLIALFGRPEIREDHARLAADAALRMREELDALNLERRQRNEPLVEIRVGVNTGSIMVGLLGGNRRYDYSVLGNEVNIAARFETLNKDFGTNILVGEPTLRQLRDEFICRPLGSISLKGKSEQVSVYELVCRTGTAISPQQREFLKLYEVGYMAIRANRFSEAIAAFNQALVHQPDDLATRKLLARAEERTRTRTSTT